MKDTANNTIKGLPLGGIEGAAGRPLLMDGAMGSLIQAYGLTEEDFRGEKFRDWKVQLKGNNDVLALTRPDIVSDIHRRYIEAGADIIITDTFSSQRVSQQEYLLGDYVQEMNRAAVRIAREAADSFVPSEGDCRKKIYVLGDVGPTSRMLSMSDDVNDPAARSITFDELEAAYSEQMKILIEEGVDGIIIETAFDTLNVKAALSAFLKMQNAEFRMQNDSTAQPNSEFCILNTALKPQIPLFISMTISDASGRTLSGQTIEAFVASVAHANPLVIGMNCGLGAEAMVPYLRRMRKCWDGFISCHPNAGLPNQFGEYDDTPEDMVRQIRPMLEEGLVNVIGGCCGTTPEHIKALAELMQNSECRIQNDSTSQPNSALEISGLEAFHYSPSDFVVVGERCNVAGSRKFLRLINEKKYDEALDIARTQVEKGAMVIDVNMDDGLLDAKQEMITFLNLLASDPSICRVPIMVDSSRFDVIETGLKCCQGKCIVNSISLKQGEQVFLEQAKVCKRLGAAIIVMLFDEEGQANDYDRRIAIASRAYKLLTEQVGISPNDIIFDPNVLTIATGMAEHANYARDFIRAAEWITNNLPGARISGGLSNLSFAFRGNNYLREAMHSVFLHLATKVGMNMAIMNPATAVKYETIDAELRDAITAVIMNTSEDASECLTEMAQKLLEEQLKAKEAKQKATASGSSATVPDAPLSGIPSPSGSAPVPEASASGLIQAALIKGITTNLEAALNALLAEGKTPLEIISGPLMSGMNTVGKLFGEGKMFLPQVVKTARTMKKAVEILLPQDATVPEASASGPCILLATVKGDVHDIGKNIVGVVLACNGFRVIDLGVMVPTDTIVEEAIKNNVDIVCLSGLITPSLDEMCRVAEAMQKAGLDIPLFVGGATTSEIHTAVKLAPLYAGGVFHMKDASQNPVVAMQLMDPEQREEVMLRNRSRQQRIRLAQHKKEQRLNIQRATSDALGELTPLQRRFSCDWQQYTPVQPPFMGQGEEQAISVKTLIPYIDWLYFYWAWRVKEDSEEGRLLRADAEERLQKMAADERYAVRTLQAFYPARGKSDSIELGLDRLPTPRQPLMTANGTRREQCLSLCDYVSPLGNDYIGVFAATMSETFVSRLEALKQEGNDDYEMLLLQTIGDRLAEAASEYLSHELAANNNWHGIRPAVGYPSLPDQKAIFHLAKLIDYSKIGIALTENGAMYPQASVTGLYLSHPNAVYFSL